MDKIVCLDPGHGGDSDNGAVWGYDQEDDINLNIAFLLDYELRLSKHDYRTVLTRDKDETVSLRERCKIANEAKAYLFLSIHCDAYHNTTVQGMTVYIYRDSTISGGICRSLEEQLSKDFPKHTNRGIKECGFHVLKYTDMKAALVECEYLSNPEMRKWLHEPENQKALAISLRKGIDGWFYGG